MHWAAERKHFESQMPLLQYVYVFLDFSLYTIKKRNWEPIPSLKTVNFVGKIDMHTAVPESTSIWVTGSWNLFEDRFCKQIC
jgi:hypothetical protein